MRLLSFFGVIAIIVMLSTDALCMKWIQIADGVFLDTDVFFMSESENNAIAFVRQDKQNKEIIDSLDVKDNDDGFAVTKATYYCDTHEMHKHNLFAFSKTGVLLANRELGGAKEVAAPNSPDELTLSGVCTIVKSLKARGK